ncbi:MAG: hypothetical protein JSR97_03780 [Verrucomicrobia bacterium]|nr:hypothetical protein [Verrucomicrobiota bacterium]
MTGQEFKILFRQDKAYLTPEKPLTLSQVSLPEIAKSFKAPAYWTIRVLNYKETEQKLFCEVLSYQVGDTDFPSNQKALSHILSSINNVTFRSIDTSGLLKTLASTTPISVLPVKETPVFRQEYRQEPTVPVRTELIIRTITETFHIPLKNVRFKLGGVSFDKKLKDYNQTIEFTIDNYDIREEFDAVKNYFANVLNTKKIEVTATVELRDNEVTSKIAKSPEIDKINKELIDNVKFEFVKATKKKVAVEVDKNLFTMEEYFETFGEENFKSNTFYSDEKELFEDLLKITNTKHYKHLRFLSSKHRHQIMKLRFIHKPFSFIFLIEGDRNYHLIWETLDTEEATYIWHLDKNLQALKNSLRKIEDIINVIKVQGKTAYINSTEDEFRRIYHDYSEIVDGFIKWKGELESVLT